MTRLVSPQDVEAAEQRIRRSLGPDLQVSSFWDGAAGYALTVREPDGHLIDTVHGRDLARFISLNRRADERKHA